MVVKIESYATYIYLVTMSCKRILQRHMEYMREGVGLKNLQSAYGLSLKDNESLDISVDLHESHYFLHIYYTRKPALSPSPLDVLPDDILYQLGKYLNQRVHLVFRVDLPESYPFKGPHWSLESCVGTCAGWSKALTNYYTRVAQERNSGIYYSWSPASNIDNDILGMIADINDFANVLQTAPAPKSL